jgi:AraC-like DNA-binding protein
VSHNGAVADHDWARYWRSATQLLEAMHAHFRRHAYHRHSHETYSFGLTEQGAQAFDCRGAARTSAAGMVMAFNPDEPHDGHAAVAAGFTYRIVHIGPSLITDLLSDKAGKRVGLPLFAEPVQYDPVLAAALRRLYDSLTGSRLARDESLAMAVSALVQRGARSSVPEPLMRDADQLAAVRRVEALLHDRYSEEITSDELAEAAGCSRFALYRAFRGRHGMAPSDYQRQLRLRAARRLLAQGHGLASAATEAGFADQAHLTRWFRRYYGITPGLYRASAV